MIDDLLKGIDLQDTDGDVPDLSDELVEEIVAGLEHVEETSGIRDAYIQPAKVRYADPAEHTDTDESGQYERLFSASVREYVHADRPPTPREVDANLDREQLRTAQKEISTMRDLHLQNRPYITFDMDAQHAQLSVSIKQPAMKKLMYELAGKIDFG